MKRRATAAAQPLTGRQRLIFAVVMIGMVSTTFPISILSVSLPAISRDMDISPSLVSWVVTAPILAMAIATPVLGRLGDLHGHRLVFIAGFFASTVLAVATAFAWDGPSLIVFRTLAQLCGAATGPSSMAIILTIVSRGARLRAIGTWSLASALSPSLGLVVGGPLIDTVGWRAVFIVQAVPAAVCVLLSLRILPSTPKEPDVSFDILGSATLGLGVLLFMLGLNRGAVLGWTNPLVLTSMALSPIVLAAFVRVERRCRHPLLPLQMLANRNVSASLAAQPFMMGPFQGAAVVAPFLMESEFGFGATAITLVALARTMAFAVLGASAGRVTERIGERRASAIGTLLVVCSMAVLALSATSGSLALLVLGMLLVGGGAGFARTPFTASLTNAVPDSRIGVAFASLNLTTQIGASIGITAMTTVLATSGGPDAFVVAFVVGALIACGAVLFAFRIHDDAHNASELSAVPAGAT